MYSGSCVYEQPCDDMVIAVEYALERVGGAGANPCPAGAGILWRYVQVEVVHQFVIRGVVSRVTRVYKRR
jgi:hypothetical protein